MSGRGSIDTLLYVLEDAFRGRGIEATNGSQALLANLVTVPAAAWRALPAASEINHLRSLIDGDDRWRHVQLGYG